MELDGPDRDSDAQEFIDAEEDLQGAGAGEAKGTRETSQGATQGKHVAGGKGGPKVKHEGPAAPAAAAHPMAGGKTLRSDNTQAPAAVKVGATLVEITTFNIMRNEFEHEYDNEAEMLIGMQRVGWEWAMTAAMQHHDEGGAMSFFPHGDHSYVPCI